MGLLNGRMVDNTKGIGKMASSMAKAFTLKQMDLKRLVYGRMVRTFNG